MNGHAHSGGGSAITILYKIVNSDCDSTDPLFNAFSIERGQRGPTLASVKQRCAALHGLNQLGPEGYHWRVCVEDKAQAGSTGSEKTFSWWDIQDENAVLPIKEAPQSELAKFFSPPKHKSSSSGSSELAHAKGALKSFGKALNSAVVGDGVDSGPPVPVVAFKLLDLVKIHDDFNAKNQGRGGHIPSPQPHPPQQRRQPQPSRSAPPPSAAKHTQQRARAPAHSTQQHHRSQPAAQAHRAAQQPAAQARRAPAQEASLMDFGDSAPAGSRGMHHSANPNETRAEKLKREYAAKKQNSNRVWDDVDQRWVEVDPAAGAAKVTKSAPPGGDRPTNKKKEVGITLDPANAVGKSAGVQAAVNKRVNDMKESQAKALQEVREREAKKKTDEAAEDEVRRRLEPRIKTWSEEHGKKKQLRALLASLHTILWPEANWKQIGIGDLLDESKCKRAFHKASRVVHPDKTHHLDPEKRFLAKRVFDALSQAKNEFDNSAK